jgi:L-Ala-D/L-Glu epimerase
VTSRLRVQAEILTLRTRHPFKIARGHQDSYRTVLVKVIDDDGLEGWGEAAPQRFYGETPETVLAALEVYATAMPGHAFDL